MVSSHFLFAANSGLIGLTLGVLALLNGRNRRVNRLFAGYAFMFALLTMPGTYLVKTLFGHAAALYSYRFIQLCMPVSMLFFIGFLHELLGVYGKPDARAARRGLAIFILLIAPFYGTSFMVRDIAFNVAGTDMIFTRRPGPLYLVNLAFCLSIFIYGFAVVAKGIIKSSGIKRNQLKFVFFGMVLGLLAYAVQSLAFIFTGLSWASFPLTTAMMFLYGYAIFKHNLLAFDLWMKRVSAYGGVYLAVLSLPILIYFPFRGRLLPPGEPVWAYIVAITMVYGIVFALSPGLAGWVRDKIERKRWAHLRSQLDFMRATAARLANESAMAPSDLARDVVSLLSEFFQARMKTPLTFIVVALYDAGERESLIIETKRRVDEAVLSQFIDSLKAIPASRLAGPFSALDVSLWASREPSFRDRWESVRRYMEANEIEVCAPCVYDGRIYGVLLLGPKEKGIFMEEEITTLQIASAHIATAARKSELISRNKELHDLDQLKGTLISNITHDFKSPIHVVETAVESILNDLGRDRLNPDKIRDYLMMIRNNTGRLNLFILNLLEIARIEKSKVDLRCEVVDLGEVLEEAVRLFKPLAEKKGLALDVRVDEAIPVEIDTDKINQVFCNLVENAIKFTLSGTVTIALSRLASKARVEIRDTGKGIEPRFLKVIFDRFFQASSVEKADEKGIGLGLSISKTWVDAHGGRIWAESTGPGNGAVFVVELPFNRTA